MPRFIARPVEIEAMCFEGTAKSGQGIQFWSNGGVQLVSDLTTYRMVMVTPHGEVAAHKGDWVIKDVAGRFYPCDPEVFKIRWKEVKDDD
jgi:hypothetical protein